MQRRMSKKDSLLFNTNFMRYLAIRWFNSFAVQAINLTVGWQIYNLTGNPLDLGLIGLAQFAPIFLLILPAGLIADKYNRKNVTILTNIIHVFVAAYLLYYSFSEMTTIYPVLFILCIHGIARAIYQPSMSSILPNIVSVDLFPRAVSYYSSVSKLGHLAGPVIAGILIAYIDNWVYLVASISFFISVIFGFLLQNPKTATNLKKITIKILFGGFAYVWKTKIVLGTITIDLAAVLFSGIMGMLPVFAVDILKIGPEGLGMLRSMPAVGGVVTGILLTQLPPIKNAGKILIYSTIVFGVATIIFSLSTILWLSLIMLVIYGAADMVSVNIRNSIVPIITPDNMRGRVGAVHSLATNASNEIGDFRAGLTASFIGTVPAIFIGGVVTITLSAMWWFLFPDLKNIKNIKELEKK
ncbi:MAG: MFS transporter [Rhodobiaceae bacterium]|nr:MFS transporter [Rhodobiaceae bacterium]